MSNKNSEKIVLDPVIYLDRYVTISGENRFGFNGAVLYGINAVIGSGIFLLPRHMFENLGPASIIAILIDVVLVLLLSLCFAEVSGYIDKNGGVFQYSEKAFGEFVGFNLGLLSWIVSIMVWAAMAAGFAKLMIMTWPGLEGLEKPLGIGLVIILSAVNSLDIRLPKMFVLSIAVAKLIPIVLFSLVTLFFIREGIGLGHFSPFLQLSEGMSLSEAVASTSITMFYVFIGFEVLPAVANEMEGPTTNVPKAIMASTGLVSIMYMLIMVGTIAMLGVGVKVTDAPVQDALAMMIGPRGRWIISLGALVSIIGLNIGDSIMIPRLGVAISDQGLLPKAFGVKNKRGAPIVAIIISAVFTILLLGSGTFEELANLSVVFRFLQYIPAALSVIVLRKKYPEKISKYRLPLGPLIPGVCIVVSIWLLIMGANKKSLVYLAVGVILTSLMYLVMNKDILGSKRGKCE